MLSMLLAEEARTYYRFARAESLTEWWQWLLVLIVCVLIGAYVVTMYFRDTVELPRGWSFVLISLRLLALLGVLFYFLDLEKGSERRVTENSRVAMLIDTSQSMGLSDPGAGPRIEQVIEAMAGADLLPSLRADHDVMVYRFDEEAEPHEIAAFRRLGDVESSGQKRRWPGGESCWARRHGRLGSASASWAWRRCAAWRRCFGERPTRRRKAPPGRCWPRSWRCSSAS